MSQKNKLSSLNDRIGIVILAAGNSSRLDKPKQLLLFKGKTLLRHVINEALHADAGDVVVVLGADATTLMNEIDTNRVTVIENTEWEKGMATSLKTGLKAVTEQMKQIDGVIFMLCDQPFVSSDILNSILKRHRDTGKPIVASNYGEATGPPAFFHQSFFEELMLLKGDEGARKIIPQNRDKVETVLFPEGSIDIDKKEDYESLVKE